MPSGSIPSGKLCFYKGFVFGTEGLVELFKLLGGKLTCIAEHESFFTDVIGNAHFVLSGSGTTTRIIVKQGGGFRDFDVIKFMKMSEGRFPFSVRGFVLAHEKERFFLIPLVKPLKGLISNDVGGVSDMIYIPAVGEK